MPPNGRCSTASSRVRPSTLSTAESTPIRSFFFKNCLSRQPILSPMYAGKLVVLSVETLLRGVGMVASGQHQLTTQDPEDGRQFFTMTPALLEKVPEANH